MLVYSGTPKGGVQAGINCVPVTADAQGDLEAQGYVQMGYTAATCDATHAGALRWNPYTGNFEGCAGAGWQPFGGVPSGTLCGMQTNSPFNGALCQGYAPYRGTCPPGWSLGTAITDTQAGAAAIFCVKD